MANTYTDLIKLRMPALGDAGWDDEINDNTMILEVILAALQQGNGVVSGLAPSDGGGLDVDYTIGVALCDGALRSVAASSKTATANLKNWLYVDDAGAVQISTSPPTGQYSPIALIDAGAATITRIADLRLLDKVEQFQPSCIQRAIFTYNGGATAYTIKAKNGKYRVKEKVAAWGAEVTTNAIGAPAASTRYYLYLDYSAITSGKPITATELIWSSTAPTWNDTYGGPYNGDDLCIFGWITNAGPTNGLEFFHDGDYVQWADFLTVANGITPSNSWADVDCAGAMPGFSTRALCTFLVIRVDTNNNCVIRVKGQTGAVGHRVVYLHSENVYGTNTLPALTDANQEFQASFNSATAGNSITAYLNGWFFPIGM